MFIVKLLTFLLNFVLAFSIFISPSSLVSANSQLKVLGDSVVIVSEGAGAILPDSPFFFLDKIRQTVRLLLAFTPEQKAKVHASIAGERLAELQIMLAKNNAENVETDLHEVSDNLTMASNNLARAKLAGRNTSSLAKEINDSIKEKQQELDLLEGELSSENAVSDSGEDMSVKITNQNNIPTVNKPLITVFSPNDQQLKGWEIGKTYDVVWNYSGPSDCAVSISLFNPKTNVAYGITKGRRIPVSLEKYSFTVSSIIPTGEGVYRIEVIGRKGCGMGQSGYFDIIAPTITLTSGEIKVIESPIVEIPLTWTRIEGTVKYNLYLKHSKGGNYGGALAGIGDLSYSARVSAAEDNYFMVQACNSSICYSSNEVYVSKELESSDNPSITVLSPNGESQRGGAEEWVAGQAYEVKWTSNNLPAEAQNKISISLVPEEACKLTTKCHISLFGSVANSGSKEVTIPSSASPGNYKVLVGYYSAAVLYATEFITDQSDGYFKIVK